MLPSEGQLPLLQNDFRFLKGIKCNYHLGTLFLPRKWPRYGAQGFPFCAGNWNGDYQHIFDDWMLIAIHANGFLLMVTVSCSWLWNRNCSNAQSPHTSAYLQDGKPCCYLRALATQHFDAQTIQLNSVKNLKTYWKTHSFYRLVTIRFPISWVDNPPNNKKTLSHWTSTKWVFNMALQFRPSSIPCRRPENLEPGLVVDG